MGPLVEASEDIRFEAEDRQQRYGWVEQVLIGQGYAQLGKAMIDFARETKLRNSEEVAENR